MNEQIILNRLLRDPKKVFYIGKYAIPKIRDDGIDVDIEEERENSIKKLYNNPNYPNFIKRLDIGLREIPIEDRFLFESIPEFPLIIENKPLFDMLLGEESRKHHWRADILFPYLGIIVELDSKHHDSPKMDNARDRYILHTWGIRTLRVELGLQDNNENKETLDQRFSLIWKEIIKTYGGLIKQRKLSWAGKPSKYEVPVPINYYSYLIREFKKSEKDMIKLCEKYLESQPGFYTMSDIVLYRDKIDKKDKAIFDNELLYTEAKLKSLVSYIYEKDLKYI